MSIYFDLALDPGSGSGARCLLDTGVDPRHDRLSIYLENQSKVELIIHDHGGVAHRAEALLPPENIAGAPFVLGCEVSAGKNGLLLRISFNGDSSEDKRIEQPVTVNLDIAHHRMVLGADLNGLQSSGTVVRLGQYFVVSRILSLVEHAQAVEYLRSESLTSKGTYILFGEGKWMIRNPATGSLEQPDASVQPTKGPAGQHSPELLNAGRFQTRMVQTSIFTSDLGAFSSSTLLAHTLEKFETMYNGPPAAFPLPPQAPAEVPRIVLSSASHEYELRLALSRSDAIWRDSTNPDASEGMRKNVEVLLSQIRNTQARINRAALVLIRECKAPIPAIELARHFFKAEIASGPLGDSQALELHSHIVRCLPNGMEINNWIKLRGGPYGYEQSPLISVEQDMNTPAGADISMSPDALETFFSQAYSEADRVLQVYLAEGDRT